MIGLFFNYLYIYIYITLDYSKKMHYDSCIQIRIMRLNYTSMTIIIRVQYKKDIGCKFYIFIFIVPSKLE